MARPPIDLGDEPERKTVDVEGEPSAGETVESGPSAAPSRRVDEPIGGEADTVPARAFERLTRPITDERPSGRGRTSDVAKKVQRNPRGGSGAIEIEFPREGNANG